MSRLALAFDALLAYLELGWSWWAAHAKVVTEYNVDGDELTALYDYFDDLQRLQDRDMGG